MNSQDRCFIITPIGDDSDPIRRHIEGIIDAAIRPALCDKYELVVAHKISEPGSITKQIIKEIYSDKLAIANLTNKNPNVMYELAFRHSLGKPVIMIAEKGTPLPSDIIMERTIFYQNDAQGVLELKDNIIAAEAKIDFNKEGSPIYDVIQEFDREAQIIKISETQFVDQSDKENSNILWYILQKLNNLEDSVQAIRSLPQSEEEYIPPKRTMFVFNYEENSRPYQVKRIFDRLQKVRVVESCIIVEDIVQLSKKHDCSVLFNIRKHDTNDTLLGEGIFLYDVTQEKLHTKRKWERFSPFSLLLSRYRKFQLSFPLLHDNCHIQ